MDQQGNNIRVVFRSAPAPTEQRSVLQQQVQSTGSRSSFGAQQRLSGVTQQKIVSSGTGSAYSRKSVLPNTPYSSGAGSLAVLPDNRASNFGLSGSQRGRPRGRRPLRGQFPVVPMDMVRQLGIEQQVVLQPAAPVGVKNKGTLSKPLTLSRRVQCQPYRSEVACQTEDSLLISAGVSAPVAVPVPVPFYVPVPMKMYSDPTPVAIPVPVPVPVPIVLLLDGSQAHDFNRQLAEAGGSAFLETEGPTETPAEVSVAVAPEPEAETTVVAASGATAIAGTATATAVISGTGEEMTLVTETGEMLTLSQEQLRQLMGEDWAAEGVQTADLEVLQETATPAAETSVVAMETSTEEEPATGTPATESAVLVQGQSAVAAEPQPGERRSASIARLGELVETEVKRYRISVAETGPVVNDSQHRLKFSYGLKAWNHWMRTKYAPAESSRPTETDILKMPIEQLAEAMSTFVRECRKPTGEEYTKDSVFYLCLGLQLYLNENGREVNIFHDPLFSPFSRALDGVIENYETRINAEGLLLCRIEEEHLWECRQLGAYPPATLLFTLMYFITKHFQVPTVPEHKALTMSQLAFVPQRPVAVLRYLPSDQYSTALEISANEDLPLKCPVHLIEFYYAKCPPKNQNRSESFYLTPDHSATMDSPVWFTSQPLPASELKRMLSRIRLVKEIQETYSTVAAGSGRQY